MSVQNVRTRFAPSPTGYLHIGGARTALYSYLIAKRFGGKFILRIEDTDLERSTPEAIQAILEGMNWLELTHDEGPFYQTKRFEIYNQHVDKLVNEGKAYPCFCTAEDIEKKRNQAVGDKQKFKYDRTCYKLSADERKAKLASGTPHCIRFYSSDEGTIRIDDKIKGEVLVEAKELDDLIIRRTDGSPTYNFCVVVDDALMNITHVIRGDDHLNNTPRQIQMYEALGFPVPVFAHCSMIMGGDGKKMSKRHGATGVIEYKNMGYLPQAVRNYIVRLGWSHKDQEIFSMAEMIEKFDLDHISPSSAIFDVVKLQWLNGHYIRESKPDELYSEVKRFLIENHQVENPDETKLLRAIEISREKVKTLVEMAEFIEPIFKNTKADDEVITKNVTEQTLPILKLWHDGIKNDAAFTSESLHALAEQIISQTSLGMGKVANPLRVVLSGRKVSPGAFDMMLLLGKAEVLARLSKYVV